jgi:RNA polymerase sigma-70 factor (ECF subfamily)
MDFKQLVKENEKKLYARAFILMGRNEDDAWDLYQMSYEKIYKSLHSLEDQSKFLPWAYTIMRNTYIDYYRSQKNSPNQLSIDNIENFDEDSDKYHADEISSLKNDINPEVSYVIREKLQFTLNLISQMKPIHRDMLNMHMNGSKYEEIAKELDIKVGTVMSTLSRLREKIAIEWDQHIKKDLS